MTLDDIVQAERELEQIHREIETERAHHGARVTAVMTGVGGVGFHYLYSSLSSLSSLSPLSILALAISAAAYLHILVPNISQALNLLDRKKLQLPKAYEIINSDSLMIFNTGDHGPLLYDRFLLHQAPPEHLEKYLTDQAEAHQKFCHLEKDTRNQERHDSLRKMVEAELGFRKKLEFLSEKQINFVKMWANLRTAPGFWLRGTTGKRYAYDNTQNLRIIATDYHLLSTLLGYGAEFFQQGYQRPDLSDVHKDKLSQCLSAAEEGAVLCRNRVEFYQRFREASERHYQLWYPPSQKIHRWLPL